MGVLDRAKRFRRCKTVHYPNGGKPVTITYRRGKVTEITAGG